MGGKKEIYQYIRFFHGALHLFISPLVSYYCPTDFRLFLYSSNVEAVLS